MSQRLLDDTAETASIADRLEFLRVLEDSQTPILMVDAQGVRHLVYLMETSYAHLLNRLNEQEEIEATLSLVDASDGAWQQPDTAREEVTVAVATSLINQTNFVWGPAAADTFNWSYGVWS